jgi:AcrR family transcriptional regulator
MIEPAPSSNTRLESSPRDSMTARRRQILEAFKKRLDHYGYDKTTMAEIAADVGISVGTLYLEFDSKENILAALLEETAREFQNTFLSIASSDRPASVRLKEVLLARVQLSDRCCRKGVHSGDVLLKGAPKCQRKKAEEEGRFLGLVERLIREGVRAGELDTPDAECTARVLRDALTAYLPPHSMTEGSEQVYKRADELVGLMIKGLDSQDTRRRRPAVVVSLGKAST